MDQRFLFGACAEDYGESDMFVAESIVIHSHDYRVLAKGVHKTVVGSFFGFILEGREDKIIP